MDFALTTYYSLCYLMNAGNFTYHLLAMEASTTEEEVQNNQEIPSKVWMHFYTSSYQVWNDCTMGKNIEKSRFKIGSCCVSLPRKWFHAVK